MLEYEYEDWFPVWGYSNYEISNYGRVWNVKYSRFVNPRLDAYGYEHLSLSQSGKVTEKKVHRLVAEAFIERKPFADQVNHLDGDKTNNYVENLEWTTAKENVRHAFDTGLNKSGRRRPVKIIETGKTFESLTACAEAIGGTPGSIYNCIIGKSKTCQGFTFEYI